MSIGLSKGYTAERVVHEIEKLFERLPRHLSPLVIVELGKRKLKYADGKKVRLTYVSGKFCYFILHVYGLWEEGNKITKGAKPIVLRSNGARVEIEEEPPFTIPETIPQDLSLSLLRNVVLDAIEFHDLLETIKEINEGKKAPPTWKEVYDELIERIKDYGIYHC